MENYKDESVLHAALCEMVSTFVLNVKRLDAQMIERRLRALNSNEPFVQVIAQFNAVANCVTSADAIRP